MSGSLESRPPWVRGSLNLGPLESPAAAPTFETINQPASAA